VTPRAGSLSNSVPTPSNIANVGIGRSGLITKPDMVLADPAWVARHLREDAGLYGLISVVVLVTIFFSGGTGGGGEAGWPAGWVSAAPGWVPAGSRGV
jgi:hypothetical protein